MNDLNSDTPLPVLPDGWLWTTIGEVSDTTRRRTKPQDDPNLQYIGLEHIEAHTMRLLGTILVSKVTSATDEFEAGDVLYGRLRPYLNKVFRPNFAGRCSAEFIVFRTTPHIESKYLQYFLNSSDFVEFASQLTEGERPRVKFEQLAVYPFPFPPLAEQHRIVAAIEERLSQIDDGVTMLQRTQRRLKRYRDVILQSACEGKLVDQNPADEPASILLQRILDERRARWEAEQVARMEAQGRMILDDGWKDDYQEPAPPDTEGLPELPEGWVWATTEQISSSDNYSLAIGPFGSDLKVSDYRAEGVPLVFVRNIRSCNFDLPDTRYISPQKAESLRSHKVVSGDILITKMGEPPGDACLYPDNKPSAIITADCIKWTLSSLIIERRFFVLAVNAQIVRRQISRITKGVAQQKISLARFKTICVPLPPLAEQQRIISETEREFSIVEHIEATIEIALRRVQRLRQVVLKQAFDGKLVPQNPEDEPASRLLQRIREERARREEELQAAREAEAKQPKLRGATVRTKKSSARRPLYDVLAEANRKLRPEELFDQAGFTVEFVEEFYDELRRESPDRITIHRPNDTDVFLEVISNEAR
jgi:type I restriction enzyme S subunit